MRAARRFSALYLACLPLLACGGSSPAVDGSVHPIDGSGGGTDTAAACSVASTLPAPAFGSNQGVLNQGSSMGVTTVEWFGDISSPAAEFKLLTFSGGGAGTDANATPDWPTTLGPKSGVDINTAVDVLGILLADIGSDGTAGTILLADAGTLNLSSAGSAVGATFAGNIANAEFTHVDVGSNSVTPDPDGCTTTVANIAFTGAVKAGSAFAPELQPLTELSPAATKQLAQYLRHRTR